MAPFGSDRRRPRLYPGVRAMLWKLAVAPRTTRLPPWAGPARALGLALAEFDGGIELRPAHGNKGMVVEHVLREAGEGAVAAYLGDDWTDEDTFRALRGRGLPVLVRKEPRPTHAEAWLRPPRQLVEFLSAWNAACSERPS